MKKILPYFLLLLTFSVLAEKVQERETVAYLLDLVGSAHISREGQMIKASNICTELKAGDKVIPGKNSSVLINYSDKNVRIKHPASHYVEKTLIAAKSNKRENGIVVRATEEEAEKEKHHWNKLIDPEILKIEPVSIVRKSDKVAILSPSVKTVKATPDILLKNDDKKELIVSLYSFEGRGMKLLGAKNTNANYLVWPHTEWPPLKNGKFYQLRVLYKGEKNRINASSHSFSTLKKHDLEAFFEKNSTLNSKLNSRESKLVVKLCQLFKNDCFGDAYILAGTLLEKEPDNQFLLKMQKHCYSSLIKNND